MVGVMDGVMVGVMDSRQFNKKFLYSRPWDSPSIHFHFQPHK